MGIFDKLILARAEKIKAKQEATAKAERDRQHREYTARRELRNAVKTKLYALLQRKSKEYEENVPCELEVGDRAIINYYSLRRTGNNGWDGGPGSLLNNIPVEEKTKPVIVKITKIYVDPSLADDILDRFMDQMDEDSLRINLEKDSIEKFYIAWLNRTRGTKSIIGNLFGHYRTAHFDYDGSFKPKWGLNVDSFISDRFQEFQETFDVWQQELELTLENRRIQEQIDELNAKKKIIMEKYHKIHYAN